MCYELYVKRWYYTLREKFMWIFTFLTPNNCLSPNRLVFPGASEGKESACLAGDAGEMGLIAELGTATHSRTFACGILWTEGPGGLPSTGRKSWTRQRSAGQCNADRLNLGRESIFRLFYDFIVSKTSF